MPDPQDPATFERVEARLGRARPGAARRRCSTGTGRLIALRRRTPDLSDGRLDQVRVRVDEEAGWLVLERGEVTVAANLGPAAASPPIRPGRLLLASDPGATAARLPPDTVVILGPD